MRIRYCGNAPLKKLLYCELGDALYAVLEHCLLCIVAVNVVCKLGVSAVEVDRVKLALCGAKSAADALFLVNDRPAAAEAARGLELDLRLGKPHAVIAHGFGLALVVFVKLPFRRVQLLDRDDDIRLVKLLEICLLYTSPSPRD